MKKTIILGLIAMLIMSIAVSAEEYPLYAGQDMEVGVIEVTNDGDYLYVEYKITEEDWCITETHLHIGEELDNFPLTPGRNANPIPGQFDYKEKHDCVTEYTYEIPITWEDEVLIGAHAKVEQWEEIYECEDVIIGYEPESFNVVSDETNEYYDEDSGEWKDAVAAWVHPAWTSNVNIPGATWIWTAEYVTPEEARYGAEYEFRKLFDIPVDAANIVGSIDITTDNEYVLYINGNLVGSNDVWQNVESYDVSGYLTAGVNNITVLAVNIPWNTDDPMANPGGLLYNLLVEYDEPQYEEQCEWVPYMIGDESAWGATALGKERFTDRGNWATYFEHTLDDRIFVERVTVDSANIDGNSSVATLADGAEYYLVASGTWQNSNLHTLDAECRLPTGAPVWELSAPRSLRLQVDEEYFTWGMECADDHVYEAVYTGLGDPVWFRIADGMPPVPEWYNDNTGNLYVDIYEKLW